ncbi:unnamed protein product [Closterium sp. NIES-54]
MRGANALRGIYIGGLRPLAGGRIPVCNWNHDLHVGREIALPGDVLGTRESLSRAAGAVCQEGAQGGVSATTPTLLELYGGIATGLAAVLKVGHTVCKYLYVDNSGEANLMAWHHIKLLKARYHEQLMEEAAERGAECTEWEQSASAVTILAECGPGCRPEVSIVTDGTTKGRLAVQVTERDHPTQYPCNKVGEPWQAWPTLVAHENARGFKKVGSREGPGMVYDVARGDWEEPTAQERELAMGFMAGATACDQMTEKDRRAALGRAMDLNALHWLFTTMSNHLERKWLERRIGKATQVRPQTRLAADKEMEAWTMLGGLEEKEENKWWRGIPEEHHKAS